MDEDGACVDAARAHTPPRPRGTSPTRGPPLPATCMESTPDGWTSPPEPSFSPVKIESSHMSRLRHEYDVGKAVGKGGYAVVYKGTRRSDGLTVAIKQVDIFEMSVKKRERCLREVQLLGNLQHPAIIGMLDSFLDDNVLVIVFEWAAGGDLKRLLKRHLRERRLIDEAAVWSHFRQVVGALAHMHAHRVMHRDVKPANVLVTARGLKVGDLGLGRHFSQETQEVKSKVGTPYYVSPEVVKGLPYSWSSDVWSLGCLLYELAALRSPFQTEDANLYDVFRRISKADYDPLPAARFSRPLLSLVRRMLVVDPEARPELSEVLRVCDAAVASFDRVVLGSPAGTNAGIFIAAEALVDRLAVLLSESARFKAHYRPGAKVLHGVHAAAFFAPAPRGGEAEKRESFGRVIRVGSWLLLLLGRKGLELVAEAEMLAALAAEEAEAGERSLAGRGDSAIGDRPDTFIDLAGFSQVEEIEHVGSVQPGWRDEDGKRRSDSAKDRHGEEEVGGKVDSELMPPATEEEVKRYHIASHFLEEAARCGLATEFMCPHAIAQGHGWAVVNALGTLCEKVFAHLDIRTRAPEHGAAAAEAWEDIEEHVDGGVLEAGGEAITDGHGRPRDVDDSSRGDALALDEDGDGEDEVAEFGCGGEWGGAAGAARADDVDRDIIETSVDPVAWRDETERLGPALRRATREVGGGTRGGHAWADTWHSRLDALRALANGVAETAPMLRRDAAGFVSLLRVDTDAIDQREAYLRRQITKLGHHEAAFAAAHTRLAAVTERRRDAEASVASRTQELAEVSEACARAALAAEDAAEGGPARAGATELARLRDATAAMRREMEDMEVKMAVARERLDARRRRARGVDGV